MPVRTDSEPLCQIEDSFLRRPRPMWSAEDFFTYDPSNHSLSLVLSVDHSRNAGPLFPPVPYETAWLPIMQYLANDCREIALFS